MPMLSVITLRDLTTAHAALDILEMEHHAPVNYQGICICDHVLLLLKLGEARGGGGAGVNYVSAPLQAIFVWVCFGLS